MSDNGESIKEFLKGYAGMLKDHEATVEIMREHEYPFSQSVSMPQGCAFVSNRNGEHIASFYTNEMSPSMPVSPRDTFISKITADLLNAICGKDSK